MVIYNGNLIADLFITYFSFIAFCPAGWAKNTPTVSTV